ncbi:MAG: hypothetical protein COB76_03490 [Alphaproteobacteria bacterium]|nr:MAG: hypothetical protein COB76_03490 [Alphaproteobacteria bacterium]
MKMKSNTNMKGDTSFAEIQAKKSDTLNILFHELESVCGERQAQDIINVVRLAERGETVIDCLPVMAVGETLAFVRGEVRKAIQQVRSYQTIESVIDFDATRARQRLDRMVAIYWMVMPAYYTLYDRFMTAMKTSKF